MKHFYVSVYDVETKKLIHEKVPENVYVYIKQLETYIKLPETSKVKELYSFRFK